MLQVGLDRLRALFPDAEMHVLTSPRSGCAKSRRTQFLTIPPDRKAWCRQRLIPRWPQRMAFANRWNHSRSRKPDPLEAAPNLGRRASRRHRGRCPIQIRRKLRKFVEFLESVDLVVATGSGGLNDEFAYHAVMVLLMLHLARSMQKPVAMFGQGLGPAESPHLRNVLQQVMPQVNFLALREGRHGLPLAQSLGVHPENVVVTGDDAIEIAYRASPRNLAAR